MCIRDRCRRICRKRAVRLAGGRDKPGRQDRQAALWTRACMLSVKGDRYLWQFKDRNEGYIQTRRNDIYRDDSLWIWYFKDTSARDGVSDKGA